MSQASLARWKVSLVRYERVTPSKKKSATQSPQRYRAVLSRVYWWVEKVFAVIGFGSALFWLSPRFSVSHSEPMNEGEPFSSAFTISSDSPLPVVDVLPYVALGRVRGNLARKDQKVPVVAESEYPFGAVFPEGPQAPVLWYGEKITRTFHPVLLSSSLLSAKELASVDVSIGVEFNLV